jgi:cytochrome c oxidase assembly factor CtaG
MLRVHSPTFIVANRMILIFGILLLLLGAIFLIFSIMSNKDGSSTDVLGRIIAFFVGCIMVMCAIGIVGSPH